MAVTSVHPIYVTQAKSVAYIINPVKTEKGLYVESYMCSANPEKTSDDFEVIRQAGTGRSTILAQHLYQSFMPGEVTPEQAIEIGKKLAESFLKNDYQYVISTHVDKQHIHNHIVFNNVNMNNGKSWETLENRKGKAWENLRQISDTLCREYGLSVIENPEQGIGKSWYEWSQNKEGLSWKSKLKFEIDNAIMSVSNFDDFLSVCRNKNIECVYKPENKISLKFRMQGQERYTRSGTLGWYYEEKQIKKRIADFQLLKTGQLTYKQHTKIIATADDRYQNAKHLEKWADIQNMKEASRVINILTEKQINTPDELEQQSLNTFSQRMQLVSQLNNLQNDIDKLTDRIKDVRAYKKYKPVHDELANQAPIFRKGYEKKFALELTKFDESKARLKSNYPDGKVPTEEKLHNQRKALIEERNTKNEKFKTIVNELKELDFARTSIEEYMKNDMEVQRRKRSSDLE